MNYRTIITGLMLAMFFSLTAQKTVYQSESFETLSADHQTLAILPFAARLEMDNDENLSEADRKDLEMKEGYEVQSALEHFFLKRDQRKDFRIELQHTDNTNALLKQQDITLENLDIYTTQELCDILGVDALVSGDVTLNALISQGVSTSFDFISFVTGKSDYGRIAIKLSDGKTGKLLWKFEKTISRKSGKNTEAIIDAMMRQSTRKFPYSSKRN